MNRTITNTIRFFLDECLPPIIRDNKFFMYPLFYIWYKGKNIKEIMNFKSRVYHFSKQQYEDFYKNLDSLAGDRKTDLSEQSIEFMIERILPDNNNLLDIGCGNGYFLSRALNKVKEVHACDIRNRLSYVKCDFHEGNIEKLPFRDKQFDVVTCHHTLEHIINLEQAIKELKRVAKKQIIIVVPCQRYYYYTLDEHVNFFPDFYKLAGLFNINNSSYYKIWGDWVYIANLEE